MRKCNYFNLTDKNKEHNFFKFYDTNTKCKVF